MSRGPDDADITLEELLQEIGVLLRGNPNPTREAMVSLVQTYIEKDSMENGIELTFDEVKAMACLASTWSNLRKIEMLDKRDIVNATLGALSRIATERGYVRVE